MNYLNFNTKCDVSKKRVMELKGSTIYHEGIKRGIHKVSAYDGKILAEKVLGLMSVCNNKKMQALTPEELMEDVTYLMQISDMIIRLRRKSSGRGSYKKQSVGDEFEGSVKYRVGSIISDAVASNKLTVSQRVVLSEIANRDLVAYVSIEEFYDVVNDDPTELDKLDKEIKSLRSGGNHKVSLLRSIEGLREKIKIFNLLKDNAGDDLVNWTQHKISRWLNNCSGVHSHNISYHGINNWINDVQLHLKAQGVIVKPAKVKSNKPTSSEKLEAKLKQGETNFSQDELMTLFKKGHSVANLMELGTIFLLIEQGNTVKVTMKAVASAKTGLEARLFDKITTEKEFIEMWRYYGREDGESCNGNYEERRYRNYFKGQLSVIPELVFKYHKVLTEEELNAYVERYNSKYILTDEVFERIEARVTYGMREEITTQIVKRMTTKQKELFLTKLHTVEKPEIRLSKEDHKELINNLSYDFIKDTLIKSIREVSLDMEELFLAKKDVQGVKAILKKGANKAQWGEKGNLVELFKILSYKDRVEAMLHSDSDYNDHLEDVFNKEEELTFLGEVIKLTEEDVSGILRNFLKRDNPKPYIELLLEKEYTSELPTSSSLIECLNKNKSLKTKFLELGHYPNFSNNRGYYSRDDSYQYGEGEEFYKCFTKKQIINMNGIIESINDHDQSMYLGEFMTWEERAEEADVDRTFKIRYANDLGYRYFQKVEHLFGKDMTAERHTYIKEHRYGGLTDADKSFMRTVKEIIENK